VAGIPELLEDLGLIAGQALVGAAAGSPPGSRAASADTALAGLSPVARSIAREVVAGRSSVDELVAETGFGGATVLGVLTALEVQGLVVETFGRYRAAGPLASGDRRARVRLPCRPARGPAADPPRAA
jgi:predicted Rossmann fold nucleotide-binding protein DprA/Smf involved in DNA uptake